jgi:hypothetical protein
MKTKFLHLTFLICMMYSNAFSQVTITAQKTIGGNSNSTLLIHTHFMKFIF